MKCYEETFKCNLESKDKNKPEDNQANMVSQTPFLAPSLSQHVWG